MIHWRESTQQNEQTIFRAVKGSPAKSERQSAPLSCGVLQLEAGRDAKVQYSVQRRVLRVTAYMDLLVVTKRNPRLLSHSKILTHLSIVNEDIYWRISNKSRTYDCKPSNY